MFRRTLFPFLNPALLGYAATLFAVVAADVGCRKTPNQATVKGHVTYRGELVSLGAVTFFPEGGRPVTAPISEQGNYQVDLPPGDYVVIINQGFSPPPGFKEGDALPPPKFTLPAEFSSRARSRLKARVEAGQPQNLDFTLK